MNRFMKLLFAALMGMSVPGIASAAVLGPGINELEDIDFELHASDVNGNGLVDDGDILLAILEVDRNNTITGIDTLANGSAQEDPFFDYTQTTSTFTAVSLLKVGSVTVSGDSASFVFIAPTAAEWLALTGLAAVDANVVAIAFDDPPSSPENHVNQNEATLAAAIGTATEGTRLWEFGLGPNDGTFWIADTEDDVAFDGTFPTNINQITDLDFLASLNVIDYNGATPLNKHLALGDPDLSGPASVFFTTATHLQLQGNSETGSAGPHFDIRTDTNLYIAPVPEPASMLAWGGLVGLGMLVAARKRRRSV